MRILIVANYPLNCQESMDRFATLLERELAASGAQTTLIRPSPILGRLVRSQGSIGKWLGYIDTFVLFLPTLVRVARRHSVVHIVDQQNALYTAALHGKPTVVTCHDVISIRLARGRVKGRSIGWTGRFFQRLSLTGLKRADVVVSVSEQTHKEYSALSRDALQAKMVVFDALNASFYPMHHAGYAPRLRRMNIPPGPFVLHVGANAWYKNRMGLARIYHSLVHQVGVRHLALVVAGQHLTPKVRNWLEAHGHSLNVHETGPVVSEDLIALYSAASLLIFPSIHEGFGWPIIEAQACGCLVATTDRPPMNQIGGDAAVYLDINDETSCAKRILAACATRHERIQMGLDNVKRFTRESFVNGYIDAYRKALKCEPEQHRRTFRNWWDRRTRADGRGGAGSTDADAAISSTLSIAKSRRSCRRSAKA